LSAQENRDRKAEVIGRYALRLGWDRTAFRTVVGSYPYAERGNDQTMTSFARAAYRAAGVDLAVPHGRLSTTWRLVMDVIDRGGVVPDLLHEAPRWLHGATGAEGLAITPADPLAARVGRDRGPRGWDVVAALPPVPGATCECGEPAVVRAPGRYAGHDRWRCPDCPPQRGEWGGRPRHPSPVSRGIDWSTTPVTCGCTGTTCYCGRRPPGTPRTR